MSAAPPSARRPVVLGLVALVVLIGGFGTWATQTTIAGAVVASGTVEVTRNRQAIQHPDGGVVADILVDEGTVVEADDTLLLLDGADIGSDLAVARGQWLETRARRARLEAERDGAQTLEFADELGQLAQGNSEFEDILAGQTNLFLARLETFEGEREQLSRRTRQIASQIEGLTAQRAALLRQQSLISEDLASQRNLLAEGLTQAARVSGLARDEAELAGAIAEIDANISVAEGQITEVEIAALQLVSTRREEAIAQLREVRVREDELRERVAALERRLGRMELRAPVSGVVYGLTVLGPRSVIRPADPVMFLVPSDRPPVITARIDAIDVDQVFVGQEAALRFTAFDTRTTPELFGTISRVSADAFEDNTTGLRYYEAEIAPDEGELGRLGELVLQPGMPVEAFIKTEDRTPLTYLLRPISIYFERAFREL
ncbi:MAG: HlyD family type I secretion periplasmic adaptor subunit [Pseudomonadota bacterium]